MATKVKPSRLQVSGTPQAGDVPVYVNEDCFCWGAGGGGGCSEWGCITGTLCDQTDLQGALDCKADCSAIPTDNCQLANSCGYITSSSLSGYQLTCNMVCNLSGADNSHYPSAKAVADALSCAGAGDMLKSVYDPNNVSADAFDYCNFINTPTIPTDNCQLANSCGYTTCTGTLTSSNISNVIYGPSWNGIVTDAPSKDVIYDKLKTYDAIIPSAATCSNQLADKDYVNDSINSVTAYYITKNAQGDQWASYAELAAATTFYSGGTVRVPTRNDYTVVLDDETHNHETTRYSYQGNGWEYQYTINETPMTQAQLDALNSGITAAKVSAYDAIPIITDNCQIANGCGYTTCTGTVSTCADVISALGYTPYNSTNPSGYTTCTGTLTSSDLACYACCCDIPTDNCQLSNGCGYTTCTGTVTSADLASYVLESCVACINGCCLTQGGDICIQGGGGGAECVGYIDYLMVGGGGSIAVQGSAYFGGGGGGGVIQKCCQAVFQRPYQVIIGGGGVPGTCQCAKGGDTIFFGVAYGGGAAGNNVSGSVEYTNGGSGGGACPGSCFPGLGHVGQGYNGGYGCTNSGGGGGGAGQKGGNGTTGCVGGKGGDGVASDISGVSCYYGGGGGGGGNTGGCGGLGGGGNGGKTAGQSATYYGGGGGNGCCQGEGCKGCGCQGIVIVRYKANGSCGFCCATGGDCCYLCNGYCIHTFTSDGYFTPIF